MPARKNTAKKAASRSAAASKKSASMKKSALKTASKKLVKKAVKKATKKTVKKSLKKANKKSAPISAAKALRPVKKAIAKKAAPKKASPKKASPQKATLNKPVVKGTAAKKASAKNAALIANENAGTSRSFATERSGAATAERRLTAATDSITINITFLGGVGEAFLEHSRAGDPVETIEIKNAADVEFEDVQVDDVITITGDCADRAELFTDRETIPATTEEDPIAYDGVIEQILIIQ